MPKLAVFILLLYFPLVYSQAQEKGFDKHFPEVIFDTLHVHINLKTQNETIKIPCYFSKETVNEEYYPLLSFYLDRKKKFKAYLILSGNELTLRKRVYLILLNLDRSKVINFHKIADYEHLEGAFKKWQNAWIADFNNDGYLDIGMYEKLIDFELPTEEAENISNDKAYLLIFKNNQFQHRKWNYDILKHYQMKP